MLNNGSDRLLMVGQSLDASARPHIPHLDEGVIAACYYMRLILLGYDRTNSMRVTSQGMHLLADPNIPHSGCTVSSSRHQHAQAFVDLQAVDSAEMAVVVSDHLVHLEIPTLNGLILTA